MNLDFIAQRSGVSTQSVIAYNRTGETHILRVDPKKEPALQRKIEARNASKAGVTTKDVFSVNIKADGRPRTFSAKYIGSGRVDYFDGFTTHEGGWFIEVENYATDSPFGIVAEGFSTALTYAQSIYQFQLSPADLSIADRYWSRPWMAHTLAILDGGGDFYFIHTRAASGHIEFRIDHRADGSVDLASNFRNVHFDVANLNGIVEKAPDRPYVVDVSSGQFSINVRL